MVNRIDSVEDRIAVLVDCDNVSPDMVDHALRFVAQFGRVVVRRGYGNSGTLSGNRWQAKLTEQAFTPCLQYQFASGKNTSDIALALDAVEMLFDEIVDTFCMVTSDSDFAHLCRKLRERGARVCIVGEEKTPLALRNASDHFSEWEPQAPAQASSPANQARSTQQPEPAVAKPAGKRRPLFVVEAVRLMASDTADGKVDLGALGNYLRRTDSAFTTKAYGHSGLLDMVRTYDLLQVVQEPGGHWAVRLAPAAMAGDGDGDAAETAATQ